VAPGSHIIVVSKEALNSFIGRYQRWELRDTFLILTPGPTNLFGYLFRVPLEEKTVAAQVLKTGTGGLSIDACRIGIDDGTRKRPPVKPTNTTYAQDQWTQDPENQKPFDSQGLGRWPSNLLLIHHPECYQEGQKQVVSSAPSKNKIPKRSKNTYAQDKYTQIKMIRSTIGHGNEDGLEIIPAWICHPNCPVGLLDKQSGRLRARGNISPTKVGVTSWWGSKFSTEEIQPGDSGGASRFFPQFKNMSEMLDWITKLIG
jgi:hypothetical protein